MSNTNRHEHDEPTADPFFVMASLVAWGARCFDPVRFRYIEAMGRRAEQASGATKQILEGKLARALAEYQDRFEQARCEAAAAVEYVRAHDPDSVDDVQRLYVSGDFQSVIRRVYRLKNDAQSGPLAKLTHYLLDRERDSDKSQLDEVSGVDTFAGLLRKQETDALKICTNGLADSAPASPRFSSELQSMQFFRATWAKLSADKRVAQAIGESTENSGPLNSHRLVIRSLSTMRAISPDYLNRFVAYVDTLLWLEQACVKNDAEGAKVQPGKGKAKPRRKPAT